MMEENLMIVFHQYLDYYSKRKKRELLSIFSPNLSGFGTGPDENSFLEPNFVNLYLRELEQVPSELKFNVYHESIQKLSESSFLGMAILDITLNVEGESMTILGARLTCIFSKTQNEWKLAHKHISTPLSVQEEGETVPLKELQEQNRILQQKVQDKTQELQESNNSLLKKNHELQELITEITTLKKLLPICANCKKIRDDKGYWQNVEDYLSKHTDIKLTHSLCHECVNILYPDLAIDET